MGLYQYVLILCNVNRKTIHDIKITVAPLNLLPHHIHPHIHLQEVENT